MTNPVPTQKWPDSDPAPNVATLEEIQLAEQLRHRLELRFLPHIDLPARRLGPLQ